MAGAGWLSPPSLTWTICTSGPETSTLPSSLWTTASHRSPRIRGRARRSSIPTSGCWETWRNLGVQVITREYRQSCSWPPCREKDLGVRGQLRGQPGHGAGAQVYHPQRQAPRRSPHQLRLSAHTVLPLPVPPADVVRPPPDGRDPRKVYQRLQGQAVHEVAAEDSRAGASISHLREGHFPVPDVG